jgi:RimJ/RimL family protein N-acetyltransferase
MSQYFFAPDRYLTPTFLVCSYQPGDGPLLQEAVTTSYEHLKTFMPWATPTQSLEHSEWNARRFCGSYLLNTDFVMGIFAPDRSRLLGGTGFHLRWGPLSDGTAEIGMWIRGSEAGRGLGTQVLRALLQWGFTDWPWVRLVWQCDSRNIASIRVAEKAGMRQEGAFMSNTSLGNGNRRDTYLFAMLRSEYLADRS